MGFHERKGGREVFPIVIDAMNVASLAPLITVLPSTEKELARHEAKVLGEGAGSDDVKQFNHVRPP